MRGYLSGMADNTEKKKAPFAATILFVVATGLLLMLVIAIFAL